VFAGRTAALIPLYAVGVFVAFTFSQSGMVVHWWRRREAHWRKGIVLNAIAAALSAIVFVIAAVTKFSQESWVALLLIALLVLLTWRIRVHYDAVHRELALHPLDAGSPRHPVMPALRSEAGLSSADSRALAPVEEEESPDEVRHLAVVPIVRLDLASLRALAHAASLGQPVLAAHLSPSEDEAERFRGYWAAWGDHVPLEVLDSPYRALVAPLARYIDALRSQRAGLTVTVVLPELIVKAPLARVVAQRHRAATAARAAPPARHRDHHRGPPPGDLTATLTADLGVAPALDRSAGEASPLPEHHRSCRARDPAVETGRHGIRRGTLICR
jgi:hypothetical protein